MKRGLFFLILFASSAFLIRGLKVNDDPIASLIAKDPIREALFRDLHKNSFFKGHIFADFSQLQPEKIRELEAALSENGYKSTQLIDAARMNELRVERLATLVPPEILSTLLSPAGIHQRSEA